MGGKRVNYLDRRFGRIVVVGRQPDMKWVCQCDCGNVVYETTGNLTLGHRLSCGCLRKEIAHQKGLTVNRKHGAYKTPEHSTWLQMRARCKNPNHDGYADYGGRGIQVCKRWDSFSAFLADMGLRPSAEHSIDRIEVNGNYEPSNCRWADRITQMNNTTRNRYVEFQGKRMTVGQAVHAAGDIVDIFSAHNRLRMGWNIERAVTEPVRRRAKH